MNKQIKVYAAVALAWLLLLSLPSSTFSVQVKRNKGKVVPVGRRELQGLIVMMALLNNWDLKDSNNVVLYVPAASDKSVAESLYAISDLGATFGKTGHLPF